jgi:hypothetical protein
MSPDAQFIEALNPAHLKRFYDPKRGDVILNPLDKRCPYWGPAEELRSRSEAKALAASLFQPPQDKKGEFFIESPQKMGPAQRIPVRSRTSGRRMARSLRSIIKARITTRSMRRTPTTITGRTRHWQRSSKSSQTKRPAGDWRIVRGGQQFSRQPQAQGSSGDRSEKRDPCGAMKQRIFRMAKAGAKYAVPAGPLKATRITWKKGKPIHPIQSKRQGQRAFQPDLRPSG